VGICSTLVCVRIAVVHSAYASDATSGENIAVLQQTSALTELGHNVALYTRETDKLADGPLYRARAAVRVATGFDLRREGLPKPEDSSHVLVVHNLFPNYGTRWLQSWPGPVIVFAHNFRYVCANGLLLRDGRLCMDCVKGPSWQAVVHGCYRNSRMASLPLALANPSSITKKPVISRADSFITQSDDAHDIYARAGVPGSKLRMIPGFVDSVPRNRSRSDDASSWLFVGRLSHEKGLGELLSIWPTDVRLDVIGDGPELPALRGRSSGMVRFLGHLSHDEVLSRLRDYKGLVFPGICLEGAHPMVLREAMSAGLPVVAASSSAAARVVAQSGGGLEYDGTSPISLRDALEAVGSDSKFVRCAQEFAREAFSREWWKIRVQEELDRLTSR
jgi:glycosyltransferase involved in cell wall biosynthesis